MREHLPLVHYAVSEMAAKVPRHVSRDDLVSAGMAGLAQAARSFDPARGISFDRYASTRIRGALLDELRDRDWASRSVRSKARKVANATDDLTAKLGRAPSNDEVAGHLGLDTKSIDSLNEDVHRAVVLNYDSMLAQGDAEDVMPSNHVTPDSVMLDRERRAYCSTPSPPSPTGCGRSSSATSSRSGPCRTSPRSWACRSPGSRRCGPRRSSS